MIYKSTTDLIKDLEQHRHLIRIKEEVLSKKYVSFIWNYKIIPTFAPTKWTNNYKITHGGG